MGGITVPSSIRQLMVKKPLDSTSNTLVSGISESDKRRRHASCQTLLGPFAVIRGTRTGETAVWHCVHSKESLARISDPSVGTICMQNCEKLQVPYCSDVLRQITRSRVDPISALLLGSQESRHPAFEHDPLSGGSDLAACWAVLQQFSERQVANAWLARFQ